MPAVGTRKRKQTEDMADPSPPKRVTRARAAKTAEEPAKSTKTTKTTKITTASARVAAKAKAEPAKTRAAAKPKEEEPTHEEPEVTESEETAPKTTRTRGRPKKEPAQAVEAPSKSTRTRQTKAAVEKPALKTTKATKAKATAPEPEPEEQEDELAQTKTTVTRKTTRSRVASTTKAEPAPAKKTTTKKRVAFEDDPAEDKENVPAPIDTKKKQPVKTTGLAAKPVRKTAPATRSTRGRKPAASKVEEPAQPPSLASKPLSPKKPTQIAKSASSESEDELCSASPVKALSKSPVKPPMSIQRSPVKNASFADHQGSPTPSSPVKGFGASVLASPAKRPPQSPFKTTLIDSPRKVNLASSVPSIRPEEPSESPFKESLKASPKRIQLNPTLPQLNPSPLKQSLLQSPARRPASPLKSNIGASPTKSRISYQQTSPTAEVNTFKLPSLTPRRSFAGSTNGDESPEPSIKSHTMTPNEQATLRSKEGSPSPVRRHSSKINLDELEASSVPTVSLEESASEPVANLFPSYRSPTQDSDSEDELSGPSTLQSLRFRKVAVKDFAIDTPTTLFPSSKQDLSDDKSVEALSMTPLALQLGTWCASSPEKKIVEPEVGELESNSTAVESASFTASVQATESPNVSPPKVSHFEDQMFGHDQETVAVVEDMDLHAQPSIDEDVIASELVISEGPILEDVDAMDVDMASSSKAEDEVEAGELVTQSQTSEQYGDENAAPNNVDPLVIFAPVSHEEQMNQLPKPEEILHTPEQAPRPRNKEIHTVSKVPLRAADDGQSPIKVPRKRSKSTSAPLAEISGELRPLLPRPNSVISYSLGDVIAEEIADRTTPGRKVSFETQVIKELMTPPAKGAVSAHSSPFKSVRKGADAKILRGAVVHVDVHTSEGADASGIFIDLLTSMGARCVKQWNWNPRASSAGEQPATPKTKIGITHVVYKDGGKRTLQKVREAKGLVLCVGVGWVLDCEKENKWLDEAEYAVDTSTIPRGGHNRRKSMEPTRFSIMNGSLVPADADQQQQQQTPARIVVQSPTKEFLSFSAESRRSSIRPLVEADEAEDPTAHHQAPNTPTPNNTFGFVDDDDMMGEGAAGADWGGSPTTPYFLSKGAQLVQMTCPPKQTMQSLFPVSGRIEDHPDEAVRRRLVEARRKSLQWAPKIASPLGRGVFGRDN